MRSLSRRLGSCKTVLILSLLGLLAVYEYPLIKSWYGGQQTGSPVNKDAPTSHKPKHEIEKPQRPPIQKNEKTLYEIRVVRKDGSEKHINWRDESNEKPEEAVESHIEPQPDGKLVSVTFARIHRNVICIQEIVHRDVSWRIH